MIIFVLVFCVSGYSQKKEVKSPNLTRAFTRTFSQRRRAYQAEKSEATLTRVSRFHFRPALLIGQFPDRFLPIGY